MNIEKDKPISKADVKNKLIESERLFKKAIVFFSVFSVYVVSCIIFFYINQEYSFRYRYFVILAVFVVLSILAVIGALILDKMFKLAKYEYADDEKCLLIKNFLESNDPELKAFHHAVVVGQGKLQHR